MYRGNSVKTRMTSHLLIPNVVVVGKAILWYCLCVNPMDSVVSHVSQMICVSCWFRRSNKTSSASLKLVEVLSLSCSKPNFQLIYKCQLQSEFSVDLSI